MRPGWGAGQGAVGQGLGPPRLGWATGTGRGGQEANAGPSRRDAPAAARAQRGRQGPAAGGEPFGRSTVVGKGGAAAAAAGLEGLPVLPVDPGHRGATYGGPATGPAAAHGGVSGAVPGGGSYPAPGSAARLTAIYGAAAGFPSGSMAGVAQSYLPMPRQPPAAAGPLHVTLPARPPGPWGASSVLGPRDAPGAAAPAVAALVRRADARGPAPGDAKGNAGASGTESAARTSQAPGWPPSQASPSRNADEASGPSSDAAGAFVGRAKADGAPSAVAVVEGAPVSRAEVAKAPSFQGQRGAESSGGGGARVASGDTVPELPGPQLVSRVAGGAGQGVKSARPKSPIPHMHSVEDGKVRGAWVGCSLNSRVGGWVSPLCVPGGVRSSPVPPPACSSPVLALSPQHLDSQGSCAVSSVNSDDAETVKPDSQAGSGSKRDRAGSDAAPAEPASRLRAPQVRSPPLDGPGAAGARGAAAEGSRGAKGGQTAPGPARAPSKAASTRRLTMVSRGVAKRNRGGVSVVAATRCSRTLAQKAARPLRLTLTLPTHASDAFECSG